MMCWICKTTNERDFSLYRNRFICDDCLSVLNYHYNEALKEIQKDHGTAENEFLEALEEYVSYKSDEYNETLRKEREYGRSSIDLRKERSREVTVPEELRRG